MKTDQVTAPVVEPVTTQELKDQLRIDAADEDTYIDLSIATARQWCEEYTGRKFITQTHRLYLDKFPYEIIVPFGELQSVSSITYYDLNNVLQTLPVAEYEVDIHETMGRIRPKTGYSWPPIYDRYNAIIVEFVCGYGSASTDIPKPLKQAVSYAAGVLFEHRDDLKALPESVKPALFPYAIFDYTGE